MQLLTVCGEEAKEGSVRKRLRSALGGISLLFPPAKNSVWSLARQGLSPGLQWPGVFFWGRWRMAPISRAEKASARPGTYETSAGAGAPWEMTGPPAAKSIPVEAPVGAVGELVRRGLDVVAPGLAAIAAACAPQRGDVRLLRLAWSYFSENRCSCCRRILKVPNLHGHRDIPVFVVR